MGALFCCERTKSEDAKAAAAKNAGFITSDRRKCTDVLCLILFILFWVGMLVIGIIGLVQGKPARLVYGTDYKARICGVDEGLENRVFTAYPRIIEDYLLNLGKSPTEYRFFGLCVNKCPGKLEVVCTDDVPYTNADSPYSNQAHLRWCITGVSEGSTPSNQQAFCDGTGGALPSGVTVSKNCWIVPQETESVLYRCVPAYNVTAAAQTACIYPPGVTDAIDPACILVRESRDTDVEKPAKPNQLFEQLNQARALWGRYFGDLQRSWYVILLCSVLVALVLGFLYLFLLKSCTMIIVVLTAVFTVLGLVGASIFCYVKAGIIDRSVVTSLADQAFSVTGAGSSTSYVESLNQSSSNQTAFAVLAYILTGLAVVALVMLIALRTAIVRSVRTIQLASKALSAMPTMLIFPLITVILVLALLIYWVFVAAALASSGTIKVVDAADAVSEAVSGNSFENNLALVNATSSTLNFEDYAESDVLRWLILYHLFGLLWTTQFIVGLNVMILAGAVATWYFSRNAAACEEAGIPVVKDVKRHLWSSCCRTMRSHMGTVAFGSLLIAIVQFVRIIVAYVHRQMEQNKLDKNPWFRYVMSCIQCCLACLEWCIKVVSHNAFIFTAIKGSSFCVGAGQALTFIIANMATFAVLNVLTALIFILGKLIIASVAAAICWGILSNDSLLTAVGASGQGGVTSSWLPSVFTFIFAYFIASSFFEVYNTVIDTTLICYVTDINESDTITGKKKAMHADDIKKAIEHIDAKDGAEAPVDEAAPAAGASAAAAGGGAAPSVA